MLGDGESWESHRYFAGHSWERSCPPPAPVLLAGLKGRGAGAAIVGDKPTGPYNRTGGQGPLDSRAGSKVLGGGWSKGPLLDGFSQQQKRRPVAEPPFPTNPKQKSNSFADHVLQQFRYAAAIAPLVVVPAYQLEKPLVQFDAGTLIEDRG